MRGNPFNFIKQGLERRKSHREYAALSASFAKGAASVAGSRAYAHLQTFSLAFAGVQEENAKPAYVNLVLPELTPQGIFAGIRTALEFGVEVAEKTGRPLRIIAMRGSCSDADRATIQTYLRKEFASPATADVSMQVAADMSGFGFNRSDYWIATYWTTAHALDVAARLRVLRVEQIIYLVQDYEPGFFAWSTDFALARSTYRAGFHHVVNSSPLAQYLQDKEHIATPAEFVFAPSLDMKRLEVAAQRRRASRSPRILFYARPSKPRNLYVIGLSALHLVAEELTRHGTDAVFLSAGERHSDVTLSTMHKLVSKGKLAWDAYFEMLSATDIVLSLQLSPHPSHPPLDAVTSGCLAVTNELGGTRTGLHPRLLVGEPDPLALAQQILAAIDLFYAAPQRSFDPEFCASFGKPMRSVVEALANKLRTAERGAA